MLFSQTCNLHAEACTWILFPRKTDSRRICKNDKPADAPWALAIERQKQVSLHACVLTAVWDTASVCRNRWHPPRWNNLTEQEWTVRDFRGNRISVARSSMSQQELQLQLSFCSKPTCKHTILIKIKETMMEQKINKKLQQLLCVRTQRVFWCLRQVIK